MSARAPAAEAPWAYTVGMLPHRVKAFEDIARQGVVYLRWRVAGDWKRRSLGFTVRDAKGKLDRDKVRQAQLAADQHYGRLISGGVLPTTVAAELTIAEGWSLAIDPHTGRWPDDTPHRREVERAIDRAKGTWGARTTWNSIDRAAIRTLWRREFKRVRALGHEGVRATEVVVSRVMTVAAWLRDEQKIAVTACLPWKAMKDEMRTDFARVTGGRHEVKRPRYTPEEYRALITTAPAVDPRWGLLLALGAEFRLGQVKRARRSDAALGAEPATLVIRGAGKKGGAVIELTNGQRAALAAALGSGGYLHGLERAREKGQIDDYPLFPGLRLPVKDGVPVTRREHATRPELDNTQLRAWLRATEQKARVDGKPIAHQAGRGWYGLRRAAVDAAKAAKISREGLQAHGGWSDAQVPDAIYADTQMQYARKEAAEVRAKIRGEVPDGSAQSAEQSGAKVERGSDCSEPRANL